MAPLRKLLFLGLAAAQVATVSAAMTLTGGGACPTTGSTAAISCYDNGGTAVDDTLAQKDPEPIGAICYKISYQDPDDGAWYVQGGSSSPADCTTEVQNSLATIAYLSPTVTTGTITYCTTNLCNSGISGNGGAALQKALSGASANAVAGAAVAVAVAVAAAVM